MTYSQANPHQSPKTKGNEKKKKTNMHGIIEQINSLNVVNI